MSEKSAFEPHPAAEPVTPIVCMKKWLDDKQRWMGVVCQAVKNPNGEEGIIVYDVNTAETQVEIDDWADDSIATKPWERGVEQPLVQVQNDSNSGKREEI